MNTVGKILVVLNLLFALVTGGFLVIDYATRTDYRAESEHRARLAKVAVANSQEYAGTNKKLVDEIKKLRADLDQQLINGEAAKGLLKDNVKQIEKQYRDQKDVAEKAIQNQEKWLAESQRMQSEVKLLNDVVSKRETAILKLQKEIAAATSIVQVQKDIANAALQRSQGLLKQLQEKELLLTKYAMGTTGAATIAAVTSPTYENPPQGYVKGQILKIHPEDRKLVTISVGSDVGVNKDTTLDVYRLRPKAEYLGRLLIREARPHEAVGRLMPALVQHSPLQEGDVVASSTRR